MYQTQEYNGHRLIMDSVGWPLFAEKPAPGPFKSGVELHFSFKELPAPKHFQAHGFTVSIEKGGVHKPLADVTDFKVYLQLGCKIYQESESLFHSNEALRLAPPLIVPLQNFFVRLTPTKDFGKKGERLHLSIRGLSMREVM